MLSPDEVKAINAALDQIKRIVEGAVARDQAQAAATATTGYPTPRLTRRQ
jgi:hypothetical protein